MNIAQEPRSLVGSAAARNTKYSQIQNTRAESWPYLILTFNVAVGPSSSPAACCLCQDSLYDYDRSFQMPKFIFLLRS